jgi:hypothetical protein
MRVCMRVLCMSSSSVALQSLQGPWPPHTGGFVTLLRYLVEILWTSDQPVAKACTYTGQHNTETQTFMPSAGFESTILLTKRPRPIP